MINNIMRKSKYKLMTLSLLLVLILPLSGLRAQVTIGSLETPNKGALLDLKEGKSTSTRGLALPRVKLTISKSLFPMFEGNENYKDEFKIQQDARHIGLTVYNINKIEKEENRLCPGIHVWTGQAWHPIIPYPDHSNTEGTTTLPPSETMTDGSGNIYTSHFYGKSEIDLDNSNLWSCDPKIVPEMKFEGLYWTDVNIYSTKTYDNTPIRSYLNPAYNQSITATIETEEIVWRIDPGADISTITKKANYEINGTKIELSGADYIKKFGLVYALEDAKKLCNEAEGWRMPTYADMKKFGSYYDSGDPSQTAFPYFMGKQMRPTGTNTWNMNDQAKEGRNPSVGIGYLTTDPMYAGQFNALPGGTVTYDHRAESNPDAAKLIATDFGWAFQTWMQDQPGNGTVYNSLYGPTTNTPLYINNYNLATDQFYRMIGLRCVKDYVNQ